MLSRPARNIYLPKNYNIHHESEQVNLRVQYWLMRSCKNNNIPKFFRIHWNSYFLPFLDQSDQPLPTPLLIANSGNFRLWHKQDTTSKLPEAIVQFFFRTAQTRSHRGHVLKELFSRAFTNSCKDESEIAAIAGIKTTFISEHDGFSIVLAGYDEPMPRLMQNYFTKCKLLLQNFSPHEFEAVKNQVR